MIQNPQQLGVPSTKPTAFVSSVARGSCQNPRTLIRMSTEEEEGSGEAKAPVPTSGTFYDDEVRFPSDLYTTASI